MYRREVEEGRPQPNSRASAKTIVLFERKKKKRERERGGIKTKNADNVRVFWGGRGGV